MMRRSKSDGERLHPASRAPDAGVEIGIDAGVEIGIGIGIGIDVGQDVGQDGLPSLHMPVGPVTVLHAVVVGAACLGTAAVTGVRRLGAAGAVVSGAPYRRQELSSGRGPAR